VEECDDGNTAAGDGCSPACAVESQWSCIATRRPALCLRSRTAFEGDATHVRLVLDLPFAAVSAQQQRFSELLLAALAHLLAHHSAVGTVGSWRSRLSLAAPLSPGSVVATVAVHPPPPTRVADSPSSSAAAAMLAGESRPSSLIIDGTSVALTSATVAASERGVYVVCDGDDSTAVHVWNTADPAARDGVCQTGRESRHAPRSPVVTLVVVCAAVVVTVVVVVAIARTRVARRLCRKSASGVSPTTLADTVGVAVRT
jgi:cysteine-rich repeat protein